MLYHRKPKRKLNSVRSHSLRSQVERVLRMTLKKYLNVGRNIEFLDCNKIGFNLFFGTKSFSLRQKESAQRDCFAESSPTDAHSAGFTFCRRTPKKKDTVFDGTSRQDWEENVILHLEAWKLSGSDSIGRNNAGWTNHRKQNIDVSNEISE